MQNKFCALLHLHVPNRVRRCILICEHELASLYCITMIPFIVRIVMQDRRLLARADLSAFRTTLLLSLFTALSISYWSLSTQAVSVGFRQFLFDSWVRMSSFCLLVLCFVLRALLALAIQSTAPLIN